MPTPREHDDETSARAVRICQDRLRDTGVEARRQAGALLDVRPAVPRNRVEREREGTSTPSSAVGEGDAEVKALRRQVGEWERADEPLESAAAFLAQAGLDCRQGGRLTRVAGVTGAAFGRRTTRTTLRDRSVPRHQDLVRRDGKAPTTPDRLWVADSTWCPPYSNRRCSPAAGSGSPPPARSTTWTRAVHMCH